MGCENCKNVVVTDPGTLYHIPDISAPTHTTQREIAPASIVISGKAPKTYREMAIAPSASPQIGSVKHFDLSYSLIEIEAAKVVKGFCKDLEVDPKPECPDCNQEPTSNKCLNPQALQTIESQGCQIDCCLMDAGPSNEMMLIGRVGKLVKKLIGEGVLWLGPNGMVKAMKNVPLHVGQLWHQWYKPSPSSAPIIGQPMPFPYQVISDIDGNAYGIQGLQNEDSVTIWNHEDQQFEQSPVTGFPICVRKKIPSAIALELVGFSPLSPFGNADDLRCLQRLEGDGMIHFRKVPTVPTTMCECDSCDTQGQVQQFTTVAEFIPNPQMDCATDQCPMIMAFVNGSPRWVNVKTIECLRGLTGETGKDGTNGIDGEPVTITTYNACTNCHTPNEK